VSDRAIPLSLEDVLPLPLSGVSRGHKAVDEEERIVMQATLVAASDLPRACRVGSARTVASANDLLVDGGRADPFNGVADGTTIYLPLTDSSGTTATDGVSDYVYCVKQT